MRHADHLDRKGADILDHAGRQLDQRNVVRVVVLGQLAAKKARVKALP